jgi:hypothetical protein
MTVQEPDTEQLLDDARSRLLDRQRAGRRSVAQLEKLLDRAE